MKLLFLDIDGVLISYRTRLVFGWDKKIEYFDPVALELVRKIIKETACIICLSSNWRFSHDYMELGKQLKLPILFETNHDEEGTRANQIKEIVNAVKPEKYAILDDEEVEQEFQGMPWVNVSDEDGFSYKDYLLLLEYLK